MSRYDFKEATYFLNNCVPLNDLYSEVCSAILMFDRRRLSRKKKEDICQALLTCADFLETITPK